MKMDVLRRDIMPMGKKMRLGQAGGIMTGQEKKCKEHTRKARWLINGSSMIKAGTLRR